MNSGRSDPVSILQGLTLLVTSSGRASRLAPSLPLRSAYSEERYKVLHSPQIVYLWRLRSGSVGAGHCAVAAFSSGVSMSPVSRILSSTTVISRTTLVQPALIRPAVCATQLSWTNLSHSSTHSSSFLPSPTNLAAVLRLSSPTNLLHGDFLWGAQASSHPQPLSAAKVSTGRLEEIKWTLARA